MFTLGALQFVVTICLRRTSLSFIKHPFVSNQLHVLANPQPKYHGLKMVLTSEQDRTSDSHAMRAGRSNSKNMDFNDEAGWYCRGVYGLVAASK